MDNFGKCHICKKVGPIIFCAACDHYFCDECRGKYWHRGIEFVKELIGGRSPGCCGSCGGVDDPDRP